jgi:hypothetical protein
MQKSEVSQMTLTTARGAVNSAASLVYAMALDFNAKATTDSKFFDTYNKALVAALDGAIELKSVRVYATTAKKLAEKYADIVREERTRDGDELTASKRDALRARIESQLKARGFGAGVNALAHYLDGKLSPVEQAAKDKAEHEAAEAEKKQAQKQARIDALNTLRTLEKAKDTNAADKATLRDLLSQIDAGDIGPVDALKLYNETESTEAKARPAPAPVPEQPSADVIAQTYAQAPAPAPVPVIGEVITLQFLGDELKVALQGKVTAALMREAAAELLAMAATMEQDESETFAEAVAA